MNKKIPIYTKVILVFYSILLLLMLSSNVFADEQYEAEAGAEAGALTASTGTTKFNLISTGNAVFQIDGVDFVSASNNEQSYTIEIKDATETTTYYTESQSGLTTGSCTSLPASCIHFAFSNALADLSQDTNYHIIITKTDDDGNAVYYSINDFSITTDSPLGYSDKTTSKITGVNAPFKAYVSVNDESFLPIPTIEFTAKDNYTGDLINTFNVNLTNSSGTYSLSTTNGSIFFFIDGNINAVFYSSDYHKKTYTSWDSSENLEGFIGQTNIELVLKNNLDNPIGEDFEWTIIDYSNTTNVSFSTSTGNVSSSPPSELVNYHIVDNQSAFYPNYANITFPTLATGEYNITVEYKPIRLQFVSAEDLTPITLADVTVYFPEGETNTYATDSNGYIEIPIIYNSKEQLGEYHFTFKDYVGFESPVNFTRNITKANLPYVEQLGITSAGITVNIYDRETKSLLSGRDVDVVILGILNKTTTTGIVSIIDDTFIAGDYTIQAFSDGYITEQQDITFTGTENETLDIYLLNATGTNTAFLFASVIDDFYRVQQGAKVSLLEYNPLTRAYIKVSEKLSNSNGEATFAIELNQKTYYFTASKNIEGSFYYVETLPEIIQTENEVRNLVLKLSSYGITNPSDYLNIDVSETFVNNVSTIFIDFSTVDNFITTVCVEYYSKVITNETSLYRQCVQSSSAYVATPVLINRDNNVFAKVYQNNSGSIFPIALYSYPSVASLGEIFKQDNLLKYIILFLWVALIVLMFKTENIMILLILGLVLSWGEFAFFPETSIVAGSALKTVILIFMFFSARKKEELS